MGDDQSRLDRELDELLSELRVALPGVQVLFAFLLTVPFATGFADVTDLQKAMFFVAFVATALSFALLLAPTAHHRLRWRQFDKERLLRSSTRLTLVGLAVLVVAIAAAAFVLTDVLFNTVAATVMAVALGAFLAAGWFLLPLSWQGAARNRSRRSTQPVFRAEPPGRSRASNNLLWPA